MFTGIVAAVGTLKALERRDFGARLVVNGLEAFSPPAFTREGQSICVSGVCLTVVESDADTLAFDVVPQTLAATTLGEKRAGDRVNLEPSLAAGQPMGGHFVQGHIDGIATVTRVTQHDDGHRITFATSPALMPCVVPRGSITLDGVSMTLADADAEHHAFTVAVIPTTLRLTTLGDLRTGDRVNVETDILARAIVHRLRMQGGGEDTVDWALLRAAGFVGVEVAK